MEIMVVCALLPLFAAFSLVRKPRDGAIYLTVAIVATIANAVAAQYYDLSPDGGAPERAWFPALLAFYGGWVIFCIIVAMTVRNFDGPELEPGTGFIPDA